MLSRFRRRQHHETSLLAGFTKPILHETWLQALVRRTIQVMYIVARHSTEENITLAVAAVEVEERVAGKTENRFRGRARQRTEVVRCKSSPSITTFSSSRQNRTKQFPRRFSSLPRVARLGALPTRMTASGTTSVYSLMFCVVLSPRTCRASLFVSYAGN